MPERSFVSLIIMELFLQFWAADVHMKTNRLISYVNHYFVLFCFFRFVWLVGFCCCCCCCWFCCCCCLLCLFLELLSLNSPNSKRRSEYMIAKSIPGLKCQWLQLKVVDALTELNISKLNCRSNSGSEWLVQLKRKPQLSFLFSPSLYLLSDDEFPGPGRGDPEQKQLAFTEPSPCTGLDLLVTTAPGTLITPFCGWERKFVTDRIQPESVWLQSRLFPKMTSQYGEPRGENPPSKPVCMHVQRGDW